MSLTVAICTRGRPRELARCLDSLAASPHIDQVVVSSDGVDRETEEVVQAARNHVPNLVFQRGPRIGLAANRNAALEVVSSDNLLFLDDDARLLPDFLPAALPLVGPTTIVTGWELKQGKRVVPLHPNLLGFQCIPPTDELRSIVINATIFPVEFVRHIYFDEYYRYGCEELDIATIAVSAGLRIVSVDAGNEHRHVVSGRKGNDRKAVRSKAYFTVQRFTKYEPSTPRLVAGIVGSAASVVRYHVRAGRMQDAAQGCLDIASGVTAAIQRRRSPRHEVCVTLNLTRDAPVKASVVVATHRRPEQLAKCLVGLGMQDRPPDQVLVVRRTGDLESAQVIGDFPWTEEVLVDIPGQVGALSAGARQAVGDVVAFLDDDAIPRRDWLQRLLAPYADPSVMAVGGRDVVFQDGAVAEGSRPHVGKLSRSGRLTGNHHLGAGWLREVDILKGCNSSYRREVLSFPSGLRGSGAQVANDLATSLRISRLGHRVLFEPRALIDHFPGPRFDADDRVRQTAAALQDAIYNEIYAISSLWPAMRRRRATYVLARTAFRHVRLSLRSTQRGSHLGLPAVSTILQASKEAQLNPLKFVPIPPAPVTPDGSCGSQRT